MKGQILRRLLNANRLKFHTFSGGVSMIKYTARENL